MGVKTTQGLFWSVSRKSVAGIKIMEDQLEVLGNLHLQSSLPGPFTYARNFPDHCRNTTNNSMYCLGSTPCAFICIERMTYTYIANPGFFFEFYSGKISMAANVLPDLVLSRSLTHWTGARNIASSIWAEKSSEHIRISNQRSHSWSWLMRAVAFELTISLILDEDRMGWEIGEICEQIKRSG